MSTCLNTKSDGGSIYHFCDIEAIPYGLASLSGERLSTCNGNIIYAEDVLNKAIECALTSINEKNPNLDN